MSNDKSKSDKNDLTPISTEALISFKEHIPEIIKETVNRSLKREEEVAHHGEKGREVLTSGIGFLTRNLEAAMSMGEVAFLEDQLIWAQDRLPHDGVESEHLLSRFKIYREVILKTLTPAHAAEITGYIDWMISFQQGLIERRKIK